MKEYRCYFLNRRGGIGDVVEFISAGDTAALGAARAFREPAAISELRNLGKSTAGASRADRSGRPPWLGISAHRAPNILWGRVGSIDIPKFFGLD